MFKSEQPWFCQIQTRLLQCDNFISLLGLGSYGKTELLICCTGSYAKLLNSVP